jgi:hypothetical protein
MRRVLIFFPTEASNIAGQGHFNLQLTCLDLFFFPYPIHLSGGGNRKIECEKMKEAEPYFCGH